MTEEQINQRIAEACGWTQIEQHPPNNTLYGQHPSCTDEVNEYYEYPIPNYCTDLNAMHEAEKTIFPYYATVYSNKLAKVTGAEISDDTDYFCATARQRAEAFLRALGKWEEAK